MRVQRRRNNRSAAQATLEKDRGQREHSDGESGEHGQVRRDVRDTARARQHSDLVPIDACYELVGLVQASTAQACGVT